MNTDPKLERLLGGPELSWLVDRVRLRLERGHEITGTVTLNGAGPAERDAVERLLGRRPRPGSTVSIRLDDVDAVLRRSGVHPDGLASAVVALRGPLRDLPGAAAEREAAWQRALAPLDGLDRPELAAWVAGLRAGGTVRRAAADPRTAADLVAELVAVIARLPVEPQPIGSFAEGLLGSAHALDEGTALAGLVFGAARVIGGAGEGAGAAWRRAVWASVGLLRDELSSTVLTLGLPGDPDTPTGRMVGVMSTAGEPAVLTLRQLTRDPPRLDLAGQVLSVCENPVVVAAAATRLGRRCAPLVCTAGLPGAAVMALLRTAVAAGARVRHHGDFDWGGLRIGNLLAERLAVRPWRFDAESYRAAAALGHGRPLSGTPVAARWDAELAAEMSRVGTVVEEERVVADLLVDLERDFVVG